MSNPNSPVYEKLDSTPISFSRSAYAAMISFIALVGAIWFIAANGLATTSSAFVAFVLAGVGVGSLTLGRDAESSGNIAGFGFGVVAAALGLVLFLTALALGA